MLHRLEFLFEKAFEFVGADLAHGHQSEIVGDERHQVLLLKDQRVAHEKITLFGLFDVGIEYLQTADVDHFQQFVKKHQQLALEFLATTLVDEDAANLREHFQQHFLRIAHHQTADGGAEDDDDFRRLPEHPHVAVGHGVATEHATDDD